MPGRVFSLAVGLCLLCAPLHAATLEAYGHLPQLENMDITPDGKLLAYVADRDGQRSIVVYRVDDAKVQGGLAVGAQKVRDLHWADNDHLLITTSQTAAIIGVIAPKQEYFITEIYRASTGEQRPLLKGKEDALNVSVGLPFSRTIAGHTTIFVLGIHFVDGRGVTGLYSVDTDTGRSTLVESGNKRSEDWLLDDSGKVIAASEYDNDSRLWSLLLHVGDEMVKAYSVTAPIDTPNVLGVTADGKAIELRIRDNNGFGTRRINVADGAQTTPPTEGDTFGDPVFDPASNRIIGEVNWADRTEYHFRNRDDQLAWKSVVQAFPGENVTLKAWSADRKRVIVLVEGTRNGVEYQLIDLNSNMARLLAPEFAGISADDVAEVKYIHYSAADGMDIPAFLTLPKGRPANKLPLIVFPHGGPLAQDQPGFDWWAQAMASQGYAVLQPQFRGSDGYGWAYSEAGFGQWGRKMQTDLSDGARFLVGKGLIDPKRVCIVGGSYGGYAALAGAALDHGVYRCAVSVAGVSDPKGFLKWVAHRAFKDDTPSMRFWTRFMGVTNADDPKLDEISPLAHVAEVDAPICLIHGGDDTVVPISQSEDIDEALRAAGKPVTFIRLKSEDHWLSRSETREQMLAATVQFIEQYNPPN